MAANFSELVGSDGTFADGFGDAIKTALGDDYAETKFFEDVPSLTTLAQRSIDSKRKITEQAEQIKGYANAVVPPGSNATDEQKAAYKAKIRELSGAGKTAEDYLFGKPENLPEGLAYDENHARKWAEFFHAEGVPVDTARSIVQAVMNEGVATHSAKIERQKKEFETEVGKIRASNQPDAVKEMGRHVSSFIEAYGTDDSNDNGQMIKGLKTLAKEAGVFDSPDDFDKWLSIGIEPGQFLLLSRIGKDMQAGRARSGSATGSGGSAEADFINTVNAGSPGLRVSL